MVDSLLNVLMFFNRLEKEYEVMRERASQEHEENRVRCVMVVAFLDSVLGIHDISAETENREQDATGQSESP